MASTSTASLTSQIARIRHELPRQQAGACESRTRPRTGTSSRTSRANDISPFWTRSPASTQAGANPGAATAIWALCQPVTAL